MLVFRLLTCNFGWWSVSYATCTTKSTFGKEPRKDVNPDEAVAIGFKVLYCLVTRMTYCFLMFNFRYWNNGRCINTNHWETIPAKKSQVFSTAADNQPIFRFTKVNVKWLNKTNCFPIRRYPTCSTWCAANWSDINADGILKVSAKDKSTGNRFRLKQTQDCLMLKSKQRCWSECWGRP